VDKWPKYFPGVDFRRGETGTVGNRRGETLSGIHERVEKALEVIIRRADGDGLNTIILCTHAATNIALGRALTRDPEVFPWKCKLISGGNTNWDSIVR
jgi:broad specificity phosphatase PhoE